MILQCGAPEKEFFLNVKSNPTIYSGKLLFYDYNWLVVSTPLKNMKVSWDDYSQYIEK